MRPNPTPAPLWAASGASAHIRPPAPAAQYDAKDEAAEEAEEAARRKVRARLPPPPYIYAAAPPRPAALRLRAQFCMSTAIWP
jgi:hypothetical protein